MNRSLRRFRPIGVAVVGIVALAAGALWGLALRSGPPLPPMALLNRAPPPRSPVQALLRQARKLRGRGLRAEIGEQEALDSWDPQAIGSLDSEAWRLQRLATDPTGNMRRARDLARQAAAMAHTPQEKSHVIELQVVLEHEAGHHDVEFRLAQRLLALAPESDRARRVFQRALQCRARLALGTRATAQTAASRNMQ